MIYAINKSKIVYTISQYRLLQELLRLYLGTKTVIRTRFMGVETNFFAIFGTSSYTQNTIYTVKPN